MDNYIIRSEKTAITNGVATSSKLLLSSYEDGMKVLDYGSGKLRNYYHLIANGVNHVDVLDTPLQTCKYQKIDIDKTTIYNDVENIKTKYERILCSFVLNVVELETRINIIKAIEDLLVEDGQVYIEVRNFNDLENTKTKIPYEDGYLVGKRRIKSFQKPFTENDLESFIKVYTHLKIHDVIHRHNSIIIILHK